jgi:soluble lytic murein transglycosylase
MFSAPAVGRCVLRLLACALAAALIAPAFAAGRNDDEAFRAAADAFRRGQASKLDRYAAQLKGNPLEPYARYWQLKLRLEDADAATVREMLARNDGLLLGEQLRNDWLRVLGKRSQWDEFFAEYPRLTAEDPDVTCLALQGRWRRGDEAALVEARGFWAAPRDIPDACMLLIETQIADRKITTSDVWDRVRVLLADGQLGAAKRTINYLPAADTPRERTIESIARRPDSYITKTRFDPRSRMNRELMIFALTRAARKDAERAAGYFVRGLQERFPADEQGYVWGQIATHAARQHLPVATLWFTRTGDARLTDDQLAWRARAALRNDDWAEVTAAVDRMSADGRADPTWIYWKARALHAAGNTRDAELLYLQIAHLHDFYGKLAREELGVPLAIPPRDHVISDVEVAKAAQNPSLQRALALFSAESRTLAVREWNWGVRGMSDRDLLAAADLARRYEIWDRAINTANRTVGTHDFSMRFLAPYHDIFAEQARAQGLEDNWVLGLVRQESRFISDARSSAGASGLMQLMPRTARWIARQIGMRDFSMRRVTDVDVNIALGTSYLRYVYDELGGSSVLAATAYNAGPRRAQRWRGDRALEGAIYAESIPFSETRDYVKKVMSNTVYYAAIYGGQVESLKQRLGVIPARDADDKSGGGGEPTLN